MTSLAKFNASEARDERGRWTGAHAAGVLGAGALAAGAMIVGLIARRRLSMLDPSKLRAAYRAAQSQGEVLFYRGGPADTVRKPSDLGGLYGAKSRKTASAYAHFKLGDDRSEVVRDGRVHVFSTDRSRLLDIDNPDHRKALARFLRQREERRRLADIHENLEYHHSIHAPEKPFREWIKTDSGQRYKRMSAKQLRDYRRGMMGGKYPTGEDKLGEAVRDQVYYPSEAFLSFLKERGHSGFIDRGNGLGGNAVGKPLMRVPQVFVSDPSALREVGEIQPRRAIRYDWDGKPIDPLVKFNAAEARDERGRWTGGRSPSLTVPSVRRRAALDATRMLADAPPAPQESKAGRGSLLTEQEVRSAARSEPSTMQPERRSLTRGELWQRIGAKLPEIPIDYTGSREREKPVDGFKEMRVAWQVPESIGAGAHMRILGKLKQVIAQTREPAIEHAKVTRQLVAVNGIKDKFTLKRRTGPLILDPETPKGAAHRAYNHAAMLALHDFGVLDYGPFKMSDAQKEELTPLVPFMRYTRRRLFDEMRKHPDLKGKSEPYKAEFGTLFEKKKYGRLTGESKMRLKPNLEFIKQAPSRIHKEDVPGVIDPGGHWQFLRVPSLTLAKATPSDIRAAASRASLNPTPKQIEAGNYQKGHVRIGGLDMTIENKRGSIRRGTNSSGKAWQVRMPAHYGYVKSSKGADGDHVDVYLGPSAHRAHELPVHVVDQVHADSGKFDEHKAMVGFRSKEHAIRTYDAGFADGRGPDRRKAVTSMPFDKFKRWVRSDDAVEPLAKAFDETKHRRATDGEFTAGASAAPKQKEHSDKLGVRTAQLTGAAAGGVAAGAILQHGVGPTKHVYAAIDRAATRGGKEVEARFRLATRNSGAHTSPEASSVLRSQGKLLNGAARVAGKVLGRAGVAAGVIAAADYAGDRLGRTLSGAKGKDNEFRHLNVTGYALGTGGAVGAHFLLHSRFARKFMRRAGKFRGGAKLLGAGLAITAGLEAAGTRIQDRSGDALSKRSTAGALDPRVASVLPQAHGTLRRAGKRAGKGVTSPHVAAAMGDVRRILGVRREQQAHRIADRNEAIRDPRIPLAHVLRAAG